ncbi:DUF3899 domain-containing protein [Liquorilactobacillus vini]|uniref:DUF3899 domain-containing protein n=1 Tax=Liquorilactobacillus vini DSM 20605 TaxID=1133569 RepID=A0A0R2C6R1_9LACO|nr:DUF3899 domain-containing protein [Liquorilactobacillus vini]KRM87320.1 hypothetical protein FD21_GL001313 [Liquorilactobacillus vini DSM 20605]
MKRLNKRYFFKLTSLAQLVGLLAAVISYLVKWSLYLSNLLFLLGLALICTTVVDVLLGAHLMAGWFQRRKKGETDQEYQQRKIDIKKVGELKNRPVTIHRFGTSCLIVGLTYIALAIIITLD